METKPKTLAEIINNNQYSNEWATPEAYALYIAELYTSEENRKKDEPKRPYPVSGDVERAAKEYASDFGNPHNRKKNIRCSAADLFYIRDLRLKTLSNGNPNNRRLLRG